MAKRISVVVSQGQSHNPAKRRVEEEIVAALLMERGVELVVIPHLYDLQPDGTGMLALQGISGDMVVLSWLFPRAARWILDRHDIRGQEGETLLVGDDEEEDLEEEASSEDDKERVIDQRPVPSRRIYCLDLRLHNSAQPYVEEIKRIAAEQQTQVVDLMSWVAGSPNAGQLQRFANPTNDTALGGNGDAKPDEASHSREAKPLRIDEQAARRWYPVIDYSRCTNCMECIDFCLFGVYGVDKAETILVEQPDNCRKGCPACSRVCPENAIIFPQHKTPAIAGASVVGETLKIDLSLLFGAPEKNESAVDAAVRERDEQLVLAGRDAVGASIGMPKRQSGHEDQPKDELDNLIDQLDELDL